MRVMALEKKTTVLKDANRRSERRRELPFRRPLPSCLLWTSPLHSPSGALYIGIRLRVGFLFSALFFLTHYDEAPTNFGKIIFFCCSVFLTI